MSALEMLRAMARADPTACFSGNEKNERNEETPIAEGLNSFFSSPKNVLTAGAAIIEYAAGVPRAWAEGYAALCAMPPPNGFWPNRWQRVVDAAGSFLDRWAAAAIACGWSDLDIFGCHRTRPDARFDCMGLVLLLDRRDVVAIDERGADLLTNTGDRQRFYRRRLPPGTISLWQLTRGPNTHPRGGARRSLTMEQNQ